MTLIKSISGIRGTIGGHTGDTLNPLDISSLPQPMPSLSGGITVVRGH